MKNSHYGGCAAGNIKNLNNLKMKAAIVTKKNHSCNSLVSEPRKGTSSECAQFFVELG